jgi:hypothetical protein
MNMRGEWAKLPDLDEPFIKINCTSAQGKQNPNRLAFSPMTPIAGGYKSFWCFENYWQSLKVFEDIPFEKSREYFRGLCEPKRRYPKSKGRRVLYAQLDNHEQIGYIESRKRVYVPEYYQLIKDNECISQYQQSLQEGCNLAIYDFDGPRTEDGGVSCALLTEDLLIEKLNNPTHPFGHGYIVAATIAGISPDCYVYQMV